MIFMYRVENNKMSRIGYRDREAAEIDFFREVQKMIKEKGHTGTITINNYHCEFPDGTEIYLMEDNRND